METKSFNEFKLIIEHGNLNALHHLLLDNAEINFNSKEFTKCLVPYISNHLEYDTNFYDIMEMASADYMSKIFIDLMEQYFPDKIKFADFSKDEWNKIYDKLYCAFPGIELTIQESKYSLRLANIINVITKQHFNEIMKEIKTYPDYENKHPEGGYNPYEDFQTIIKETLYR